MAKNGHGVWLSLETALFFSVLAPVRSRSRVLVGELVGCFPTDCRIDFSRALTSAAMTSRFKGETNICIHDRSSFFKAWLAADRTL